MTKQLKDATLFTYKQCHARPTCCIDAAGNRWNFSSRSEAAKALLSAGLATGRQSSVETRIRTAARRGKYAYRLKWSEEGKI